MADLIQFRRDTLERWQLLNPVLAEGELGVILGTPNSCKIGDGVHAWNDLPMSGFNGNILECLGDSNNSVISQKGITNILKYIINNNSSIDVSNSWSNLNSVIIPGLYIIINNGLPMYHMLVSCDKSQQYNQWLFGNLVIQPDGSIDGTKSDDISIIHRSIKEIGEILIWNKWRYIQEYFLKPSTGDSTLYSVNQKFFTETINKISNDINTLKNRIDELASKI